MYECNELPARGHRACVRRVAYIFSVRAVRQLKTTEWAPVAAWLVADWGLPPSHNDATPCALVVKPIDSAGSDGVTLCETVGAARAAVAKLVGATNALGIKNEAVLVQEWLRGDEYVIDGVSRAGTHILPRPRRLRQGRLCRRSDPKDLFGWGGAVKLANADAEQLVKDYAVIEALCHSGLWTIE